MKSRRDFLQVFRQNPAQKSRVVRPPYGLDASHFSRCVECDDVPCVKSCEESIIMIGEDKTPYLDFSRVGCSFCEACAEACDKGVLDLSHTHTSMKTNAVFSISLESCVAHHDVICFSCKEPCLEDAILFQGMFKPVIDMDLCTGCGYCLGRCPTQAIDYTPIPLELSC